MATALAAMALAAGCGGGPQGPRLAFSGSSLGAEGDVLRRQLARFARDHPGLGLDVRVTPDAADQRHQLYVQWLNARAPDPDVLQLDVIWTPEFAAAGWILPIDASAAELDDFVPAALAAARWAGRVYARPWFVDVGLLYYRTDLIDAPPASLEAVASTARLLQQRGAVPFGMVWQGARYEGLVTVFLEFLGAFGGGILDAGGRVIVDRPAAVRALSYMCDAVGAGGYVPPSVLTWQEEQTRFAFENGNAAFMRNWPYAYALLSDPTSRVRGRFAATSMPAGEGGRPTATLGGAQLAVNARSRQPRLAMELTRFLTAPEQMHERAQVAGQLPARRSLYLDRTLAGALPIPLDDIRRVVETARARPATPIYSELSEILQVRLHRALSGQQPPAAALTDAAAEIRALLARSGLAPPEER